MRTLDLLLRPLLSDSDPAGGGASAAVPYDRFQAVVAEKNTLAAERDALRSEVQKLSEKAATVDTLSGQVNEWKGKAEIAESRFSTFTELSGALGMTDTDVIDAFDAKYRNLPEASRPTRGDWVKTLKEKPDEAPGVLRPWLAPAQAPPVNGEPKPKPKPIGGGGNGPQGAPGPVDQAELRRIRDSAQKSGNWATVESFLRATRAP